VFCVIKPAHKFILLSDHRYNTLCAAPASTITSSSLCIYTCMGLVWFSVKTANVSLNSVNVDVCNSEIYCPL
jgi:hypothetical protein